jgi:two-component system sensor histidine kinase/response regulator
MPSQSLLVTPSKPTEPAAPGAPAQRTLLIVDDEEGPRKSLRIVFKGEYRVVTAEDGFQAIELTRQHHIDAAVLDICMGGMSGIELLGHLKEINPAIEVIILTAFETLETARQALRYGACDYLNKPFDISTMRAAVARAMQRRTLSDELRASSEKLEHLKTEIQNQRLLQETMRTRGEIYASIIHDINGPLTVIAACIDMIRQEMGPAEHLEGRSLEGVRNHLTQITRQIDSCTEISRRYLRFLKEHPTENPTVPVNQVLEDLARLLRAHPRARGHHLSVQTLPLEMQARINGTELMQILLNLAINALQCTPQPHRVEIRARSLAEPLRLAEFADGPQDRFLNGEGLNNAAPLVALCVSDEGPGIPPEVLPRVFEPFFTTKAPDQGTGLGLSIVLRLVKAARGAVHLHSAPGKGTSFTIYLPAVGPG